MRRVLAACAVTFFAAYIPFGNLLRLDVVVDGVASVAGWSSGPLHVVWRIERFPPVSSRLDEIRQPFFMANVPLRGLREVVVADLLEVPLLPDASVNEGDIFSRKLRVRDGVRSQIRNDCVGLGLRVAKYLGHRSLLPMLVNLLVALPAALRADVMCGADRFFRLLLFNRRGLRQATNVANEFPSFRLRQLVPCRHPREPHAVLNDVFDFAVGQRLRFSRAQIRWLRVQISTHL